MGPDIESVVANIATTQRGADLTVCHFAVGVAAAFRMRTAMQQWRVLLQRPLAEQHVEDGAAILTACVAALTRRLHSLVFA